MTSSCWRRSECSFAGRGRTKLTRGSFAGAPHQLRRTIQWCWTTANSTNASSLGNTTKIAASALFPQTANSSLCGEHVLSRKHLPDMQLTKNTHSHRYRCTSNVNLPFKIHPMVEEVSKSRVEYTVHVRANFDSKLNATNVVLRIPTPLNTTNIKCQVAVGKAKYVPADNMIVWK